MGIFWDWNPKIYFFLVYEFINAFIFIKYLLLSWICSRECGCPKSPTWYLLFGIYYMLWQPCTYILLESFFLSKLDASPCLLLLRCFTLKGEVHGPAHPCHVHPDLSWHVAYFMDTPFDLPTSPTSHPGTPHCATIGQVLRNGPAEIVSCFVSVGSCLQCGKKFYCVRRKILVWWRLGPNSRSRSLINLTNL